jgi:Transcriptional regulatory protein, C terminal
MRLSQVNSISLVAGLLVAGWFVVTVATSYRKEVPPPAEKINLSLRRTAHLLLQAAGDSTSKIMPVKQLDAHTWCIQFEQVFAYDQLPGLLDASLRLHSIHDNYDVTVLRCTDDGLLLGYNVLDYTVNQNVPCQERAISPECHKLCVTFSTPKPMLLTSYRYWIGTGALAICLLGLGYYLWPSLLQKKTTTTNPTSDTAPQWLSIGQSRFDVTNQALYTGTTRYALTYREAKLLHLFARHPNQVLERSYILEQVWADEGILVGRSVDMFVSRLRKILRDDTSLALSAVHGVGYRLEVN